MSGFNTYLDQQQIIQSIYNTTSNCLPVELSLTGKWSVVHNPSTATQATITKAAGATGVRHVCTGITATIATGATAQTPITVYLRDGATGAGTIIWTGTLAAPANSVGVIAITDLYLPGSAATAMTLEFSAAGVTASLQAVTLTGYDSL